MFGRNVVNPTLLFFTIKNGIVLLLETYRFGLTENVFYQNFFRLAVIATHKEEDDKDDEDGDDDDELPDDDLALAAPKPRRGKPQDVSFDKTSS